MFIVTITAQPHMMDSYMFIVTIIAQPHMMDSYMFIVTIIAQPHMMDERKSFVFARQYRNCFSQRINALVPRNQPIKTAVGIVMHDFQGLKTMPIHRVADIAYF